LFPLRRSKVPSPPPTPSPASEPATNYNFPTGMAFASSWSKERTKTVQQTTTTAVEQSLDTS